MKSSWILSLSLCCAALAADDATLEPLHMRFRLSPGMQPEEPVGHRFPFRIGPEEKEHRELVIRELRDEADLEALAKRIRDGFEEAPGRELKETLGSVDGLRAYTFVETTVAQNARVYSAYFVHPITRTVIRVQLHTVLEEFPGRRTFPPSSRDGAPSELDRRAIEAFYRTLQTLDVARRAPKAG